MGVEAFGRILTKVRSGTLSNVAERLSNDASDEAMALQYVQDKFHFNLHAHMDVSGSGDLAVARDKIFGTLSNDTDYINAIKGHQISEDRKIFTNALQGRNLILDDEFDFINPNKLLNSNEKELADKDSEKLFFLNEKTFRHKELLDEKEFEYLKSFKPVVTKKMDQIRSGEITVSNEILQEAQVTHYNYLKNYDSVLANNQNENENIARIISDKNENYSQENYKTLVTARQNILQKHKEDAQGFRNVINQIHENEPQNTNQINTPSDDFDDELDDFFRSTTNDTPINPNLNQVPPPPPPIIPLPPPTQNFLISHPTNQIPSFNQNGSLIPPPPPITPIQQLNSPFVNPQSVNQLSNPTPSTNNPLINQSQTPNPLDQVLNSSSPPTNTNTTKPTQQISPPPPVKTDAEILAEKRKTSHEARLKNNPNYAALNNTRNLEAMPDDGSIASDVFRRAMGDKENIMLQNELIGAARNNNPETVNQRIDFYKNQGVIDDKEAEPLKAFFNSSFENMDEEGVEGWFQQYSQNLNENMTPRQARLSVNQKMDNKQEGFFSTNSDDNFRKFAGRSIIGGIAGAAIGTATDDNPEAGFVAGMVGASIGRNAASLLRNNTEMFEGKMINSLLKDSAKGKTRPQQLEAVESLDDEALDFMDKMYKDKLTKNFGTSNMFENSAVTGGRAMTLSGAALAGVAFTPKKRDHRRGFNANRGNRI